MQRSTRQLDQWLNRCANPEAKSEMSGRRGSRPRAPNGKSPRRAPNAAATGAGIAEVDDIGQTGRVRSEQRHVDGGHISLRVQA